MHEELLADFVIWSTMVREILQENVDEIDCSRSKAALVELEDLYKRWDDLKQLKLAL